MSEHHFASGTRFIYSGNEYWSVDTVTLPNGGFVIIGTDINPDDFDREIDRLDIFDPDVCELAPYEPKIGEEGKFAINGKLWRIDNIYEDVDLIKWVVLRCTYAPRGGERDHTVKPFKGFKFVKQY